ncbi:unnamed protein product [Phaeothamnion confervicola]
MMAPNDIAITRSGRIFISGQVWMQNGTVGDGSLWTCSRSGVATRLGLFRRTNGVAISPDEEYLYMSEAFNINWAPVTNKIWRFKVDSKTGAVSPKKLFINFQDLDGTGNIDSDSMRVDKGKPLHHAQRRWQGHGILARRRPAGGDQAVHDEPREFGVWRRGWPHAVCCRLLLHRRLRHGQ